ncbi:MAG: hypothetical protein ABI175_13215 [Polyangiales bacterium]
MADDLALHRAADLVSRMVREREQGFGVSPTDVRALIGAVGDHQDSLAEIGAETQRAMQLVMERMAKADRTAAKAKKMFSETTGGIIGNWK